MKRDLVDLDGNVVWSGVTASFSEALQKAVADGVSIDGVVMPDE